MDNLRTALDWSLNGGEIEAGLRIAAALRWVWEIRGYVNEGIAWLEKLLSGSEDTSPSVRCKALHRACELTGQLGNVGQAGVWGQDTLRLARAVNDEWNIAWSLSSYAFFTERWHYVDRTNAMLEESVELFRKLDDPFGLSHALRRRAIVAIEQKDYPYAQSLLEEALTRDREAGDKNAVAWELHIIATVVWRLYHHPPQTIPLYEESTALFREIQDMNGVAYPLVMLADVEFLQKHYTRARALYEETPVLSRSKRLQGTDAAALAVMGMGNLAAAEGKFERAARLLGAVDTALKLRFHSNTFPPLDHLREDIAVVRAHLGEKVFEEAWAEGQAMTMEQAVAYALHDEPPPMGTPQMRTPLVEPLTTRELDVLRLMAEGLSNPQIAQQLVVATGTIKAHTNSIFGKLGVNNRVQAVNRAKELRLLEK
jgi:ATP/maltotriose-dependent transcriptional regulator MalT